jgi:hypothetical protein
MTPIMVPMSCTEFDVHRENIVSPTCEQKNVRDQNRWEIIVE